MATKTSSAVGSSLQFMPQADALYQERLQGISAVNADAPKQTTEGMLADSFGDALGIYTNFMDKQKAAFEAEMDKRSQDMINSARQEDVEALNIVDMSQRFGYGTLVDNPYWQAAVSRAAGKRLMTSLAAQYNEMYGDNQASSMEEETKRYEDFVESKQNKYLESLGDSIKNRTAFMGGFNETKTQTMQTLMNNRSERDVQDNLVTLAQQATTDMSNLSEDAYSLPEDEVGKRFSSILNTSRMSNLTPAARYKIASDGLIGLAKSGAMSTDALQKIMDETTISTRIDGTPVRVSEVVDAPSILEAARQFQTQHITEWGNKLVDHYKNMTEEDVYADIAKKQQSPNPHERSEAIVLQANLQRILQAIHRDKGIKKGAIKSNLKGAIQAKTAQVKANDTLSALNDQYEVFMSNQQATTDHHGNPMGTILIGGKDISSDQKTAFWMNKMNEILNDTSLPEADRLHKAMIWSTWTGATSFVAEWRNRNVKNLRALNPESINTNGVSGTWLNLYKMYSANREEFYNVFDSDLTTAFDTIRRLGDSSGYGFAKGLQEYVMSQKLTPDQQKEVENRANTWESDVRKRTGGSPTVSGVLTSNGTRQEFTVDDFSPHSIEEWKQLFQTNIALGMNEEDAAEAASNDFRDHRTYIGGAMIPDTIFKDVFPNQEKVAKGEGTTPIQLGIQALQDVVRKKLHVPNDSAVFGNARVTLDYLPQSRIFIVTDTYTKRKEQIPYSDLVNQMQYLGNNLYVTRDVTNTAKAPETVKEGR